MGIIIFFLIIQLNNFSIAHLCLFKGLQSSTSASVKNMSNNFEAELVLVGQLRGKDSAHRDSDVDSLGSSSGSNFASMQTGQFARLAEQLNPYMGTESRVEALKLMLHAQVNGNNFRYSTRSPVVFVC